MLIEHALHHGTILTTTDRHAAAVWLPRDTPLPPIHNYETRLETACGRYTDRFRQLDAAFDKHHPHQSHRHLALLGVHPDQQTHAHGTTLLHHSHTLLDRAGQPAYLEASDPRTRQLYLRHGYTDHGPPIQLPDHGPNLYPMWRPPHPPRPHPRPPTG